MSQVSSNKQQQSPDTSPPCRKGTSPSDSSSTSDSSVSSDSSSSSDSKSVNPNDDINNDDNTTETKYFAIKNKKYFYKARYLKEKENGLSLLLDEDTEEGKYDIFFKLMYFTS